VQIFIRKDQNIPPDLKEGHVRDMKMFNDNEHSGHERDYLKPKKLNIRFDGIITKTELKTKLKMIPLTSNRLSSAMVRRTISTH
jgi:hypothetical protein